MKYVLAGIAGLWMVDGLALVLAPRRIVAHVQEALSHSPAFLRWQSLAALLGLLLLVESQGLRYPLVWALAGGVMLIKGIFLAIGPHDLRSKALDWCLHREEVDYRLWGMGLCTLAVLLLHAVAW
jgi:hypothetical protein